jgi:23S rRNA pseudouridine2605 synthase/16S rRNA pseudouridine516 synthase
VLPLAAAEAAIAAGRVTVDGAVAKEPFAPVLASARVRLDGQPVSLAFRTRVLAFHKPAGLVCAARDAHGAGTVFEALAQVLPPALQGHGWHAVGRLDRDTTGLLLFTNDEAFVAHATSPASHLEKRYLAQVGADVTPAQLERLRRGLTLDDGPTRTALAEARGPRAVALTLTEGRWHQVKRMLEAVGLPTLALHREAIGALGCEAPVGQVVELADEVVRAALGFTPRAG